MYRSIPNTHIWTRIRTRYVVYQYSEDYHEGQRPSARSLFTYVTGFTSTTLSTPRR